MDQLALPAAVAPGPHLIGGLMPGQRMLAAEVPVAFSYNRIAHAVMMASPDALEDFAVGFSLAEGIVGQADDIEELDIVVVPDGVELRMTIAEGREDALRARRRRMAGPLGCGLCGLESLAQALRPLPRLDDAGLFRAAWVERAMAAMEEGQALHRQTRSLHAAGFWHPERGLALLREDVGRHNALDKLAGAMARAGLRAEGGAVVMTCRLSVELVQKAAVMGCSVLIAVSAPTALAVRCAQECGLTLMASARGQRFELFSGEWRVR